MILNTLPWTLRAWHIKALGADAVLKIHNTTILRATFPCTRTWDVKQHLKLYAVADLDNPLHFTFCTAKHVLFKHTEDFRAVMGPHDNVIMLQHSRERMWKVTLNS
jgi:hypothetical protein